MGFDPGCRKMINFRSAEFTDADLLLEWTNDVEVRRNSFNQTKIGYNDHIRWLKCKLADDNTRLYIIEVDGKPAGQIRIDVVNGTPVINYSLSKEFRGRGLGTQVLKEIGPHLKRCGFRHNCLIGKVKKENTASHRAFEKAGYSVVEQNEDYLTYSVNV